MSFATDPAKPVAGQATVLTSKLTHAVSGEPVTDLQILHERIIHNFIVNLDFSSFAHIHHEDFTGLRPGDLDRATFNFPYVFPTDGTYRIVSEFTHKNRSWTKHFDLQIGSVPTATPSKIDLVRKKELGPFSATLAVSPAIPVAGFETELVLELECGPPAYQGHDLLFGLQLAHLERQLAAQELERGHTN